MTGQSPDVHIHYIRYVETVNVDQQAWQSVLHTLDSDIIAALDDSDGDF